MPDFDLDAVLSSERPEVDWVCPGCGRLFELRSWYSPVDLLEPERQGPGDVGADEGVRDLVCQDRAELLRVGRNLGPQPIAGAVSATGVASAAARSRGKL